MNNLPEDVRNRIAEKIMSLQDTNKIYDLANQLGQSVSSLVQDVVHKYLRGELVEKR